MKKFYPYLLISFISSLLFVSSVSATTYNYTIPSYLTSLTPQQLEQMKSLARDNGIGGAQYIIWSSTNTSPMYQIYSFSRLAITNDYKLDYGSCRLWKFDDNLTTLTGYGYNCPSTGSVSILPGEVINNASTVYIIYVNNYNLNYPNSNDIFNYTFIDHIYSQPSSSDLKFYTISDYYTDYHTDPYPILTSFFNLVIEKLELICEFFTSNYIYLSVIVVFMFYFIIIFLRRLI